MFQQLLVTSVVADPAALEQFQPVRRGGRREPVGDERHRAVTPCVLLGYASALPDAVAASYGLLLTVGWAAGPGLARAAVSPSAVTSGAPPGRLACDAPPGRLV